MSGILLVEDDRSLGATLKDRLEKEGYAVTWARAKAEAESEIARRRYDLFILDVGLPDGTGFDLAKEQTLKPVIFLTAQGDAESRLRGYEIGAEEYIPKPFHLRELLLRVRHVFENHRPSRVLRVGNVSVDFESFTAEREGERQAAASKDLMLLKLLVEQSPRVVSRDEALNLLWGEDRFPSARTVDNAIMRLRALIGEDRIESVRGVGYRWREDTK